MSERTYIWGQCRNNEYARAHIYECESGDPMSPIGPLCIYGWNRSSGFRFSILRNIATGPRCKTCLKREALNCAAVDPVEHKTRWL